MTRIFVAQSLIDTWIADERASLGRELLAIGTGGAGLHLTLDPAIYFAKVDGTGSDESDVVGRVKSAAELEELGAEHYDTSAVIGDVAYTVVPGILGAVVDPAGGPRELDVDAWAGLCAALEAAAN